MFVIPDLDIDLSDGSREFILKNLNCVPASKLNDKGISPHGIGVYFSDIPVDNISGLASIDYKRAEEEFGYVKFDLLHNCEMENYSSRTEVEQILNLPTDWTMLNNQSIVEKLPHINNYFSLINKLPTIDSIDKLAMFISAIRPGKKYCLDVVSSSQSWDTIKDLIWIKESSGYQYKKSHAIAYAHLIKLVMNRLKYKS